MKKSTLIDMLEALARAHSLAEYSVSYMPAGQGQDMVRSVKYHVDDVLTEVKRELNK